MTSEVREAAALVVEGHQIPVVDVTVHLLDRQSGEMLWASRGRDAEVEVVVVGVLRGVVVVFLRHY